MTRRTQLRQRRLGIVTVEFTVLLVCICIMGVATWAWFGPIIKEVIYGDPEDE